MIDLISVYKERDRLSSIPTEIDDWYSSATEFRKAIFWAKKIDRYLSTVFSGKEEYSYEIIFQEQTEMVEIRLIIFKYFGKYTESYTYNNKSLEKTYNNHELYNVLCHFINHLTGTYYTKGFINATFNFR